MSKKNLLTGVASDVQLWKTKDGRLIPVSEMEDKHLLSAIRLLKARGTELALSDPATDPAIAPWEAEFFGQEREERLERVEEWRQIINAEAKRRGLDGWAKFGVALAETIEDKVMPLMKKVSVGGEDLDISDLSNEQLLTTIHDARSEASAIALSVPSVPLNSRDYAMIVVASNERARRTQINAKLKALQIEARRRKLQVD